MRFGCLSTFQIRMSAACSPFSKFHSTKKYQGKKNNTQTNSHIFFFLSFKANLTYFSSLPFFIFSGFSFLSSDFADLSTDFSVLSGISFLGLFSFDFDLKYQLETIFPNFPKFSLIFRFSFLLMKMYLPIFTIGR